MRVPARRRAGGGRSEAAGGDGQERHHGPVRVGGRRWGRRRNVLVRSYVRRRAEGPGATVEVTGTEQRSRDAGVDRGGPGQLMEVERRRRREQRLHVLIAAALLDSRVGRALVQLRPAEVRDASRSPPRKARCCPRRSGAGCRSRTGRRGRSRSSRRSRFASSGRRSRRRLNRRTPRCCRDPSRSRSRSRGGRRRTRRAPRALWGTRCGRGCRGERCRCPSPRRRSGLHRLPPAPSPARPRTRCQSLRPSTRPERRPAFHPRPRRKPVPPCERPGARGCPSWPWTLIGLLMATVDGGL